LRPRNPDDVLGANPVAVPANATVVVPPLPLPNLAVVPYNTSHIEVLPRPVESALGAVVGMVHGLTGRGPTPPKRHLQGVHDELGAHVVSDRPAQHDATERVENHGQVHLAVRGGVLGHVGHPQAVGLIGVEPAVHQIITRRRCGVATGATPPAPVDPHDPVNAHQTLDAFAAMSPAVAQHKLGVHPR